MINLQKRLLSFRYAFQGLKYLFKSQPNARIHLFALLLVHVFGIWLSCSFTEWAILWLCIGAVLAAEAFNTALESLTDLVSPQRHELAGKTKDLAAAGVLLTAISAMVVSGLIFIPKLGQLL